MFKSDAFRLLVDRTWLAELIDNLKYQTVSKINFHILTLPGQGLKYTRELLNFQKQISIIFIFQ